MYKIVKVVAQGDGSVFAHKNAFAINIPKIGNINKWHLTAPAMATWRPGSSCFAQERSQGETDAWPVRNQG
jgi:hypothetical protein